MKKILIKTAAFLVGIIICTGIISAKEINAVPKDDQLPVNRTVNLNGSEYTVKTIDYNYSNNTFISLRDMAAVLKDSPKAFSLAITADDIEITRGGAYEAAEGDLTGFSDEVLAGTYHGETIKRPSMKIDGNDVKYYCIVTSLAENGTDCYMNLVDFSMVFDLAFEKESDTGYSLDSGKSYIISMNDIEEAGYFNAFRGVVVGDATTGEIYYSFRGDNSTAIASTTKLMTYLIVRDSIESGAYSMSDKVEATREVRDVSVSADGTFEMPVGSSATVKEMLECMLLPSSNEATLALALHDAGSHEAFVEKMNAKAMALGLKGTHFVNCNGLPLYTKDKVPAKLQNVMTPEDMFILASHIVTTYPDYEEITGKKSAVISSYGEEVKNINPLLYNMPAVNGMKTGSTNLAGYCLVSSMPVSAGGMEHVIVAAEFGAESYEEQARSSELLLRYGKQQFLNRYGDSESSGETVDIPTNSGALIDRVLQFMKNK